MAFLDNSGDIILDAVLTDAGRKRMATGEFRIEKFALGDEEINYNLYVKNHASGSAFADLQIMQTPILEAFTNNTSTMKSKLISINRNNILYMPIFKLNDRATGLVDSQTKLNTLNNGYVVTADNYTSTMNGSAGLTNPGRGVFLGQDDQEQARADLKPFIAIDQGIDTNDLIPISNQLDSDLVEGAYLVRADHRLLRVHGQSLDGNSKVSLSNNLAFIDDDSIASYYIQAGNGPTCIKSPTHGSRSDLQLPSTDANFQVAKDKEVFSGPVGRRLQLTLRTSMDLQQGSTIFDEIGSSATGWSFRGRTGIPYKYIDTLVNITGVTTGQSIDIPIRIIKATGVGS